MSGLRESRGWRFTASVALLVSVLAAHGPVGHASDQAIPAAGSATRDDEPASVSTTSVVMRDGTRIAADVYVPAAPGPHPLVVMPGAWWAMPQDALLDDKRQLAEAGYVVVSYDPRGLRRSGGMVDMAGPLDVADVSDVITWALEHTPADERRIGLYSSSYGAAVGLNAAAHDARVTAVVALCPWTDLFDSFVHNGTYAGTIATFQEIIGALNGRMSAETRQAFASMRSGRDTTGLQAWALERSPRAFTAALNARRTPVFMAGEWNDPLVPAGQTGRLLDQLTGPKQLWMSPGGHGDSSSREASVLKPQAAIRSHATQWLDRFLLGRPNGADRLPPLRVRPRNAQGLETYPGWAAMERSPLAVRLRAKSGERAQRLLAGLDSPADSGLFPVAGLADSLGLPPTTALPLLAPPLAAVWRSAPLASRWSLRGSPRMHTRVTSTAERGTFVAYLYDVDALGIARLVSHAPYTFTDVAPGTPVEVDVQMPASAWDMARGHRLALVVDNGDHRYTSVNPIGSSLAFSAADTYVSVPVLTG
ncbi:CocE/NonD family hydrolase [Streptomyces sp. ISL-66]|uniref:CocE/NonD family hydrolase n=1 Tax=Streptomyces sp. ISL-66 TaxID=2819186 RepID=UPI001BEC46B0|nr:CocE/NonD family hydrolase [Streptomyces sp. ISL-66]MBT2472181.1 CocE/NonD family hydrolase [Streptomyces sp. ISL-66]